MIFQASIGKQLEHPRSIQGDWLYKGRAAIAKARPNAIAEPMFTPRSGYTNVAETARINDIKRRRSCPSSNFNS